MANDRFKGGLHTVAKVTALAEYLKAYATALREQGFALAYIDAFAGSGSYSLADGQDASLQQSMLGEDGKISMPGSARIALETTPAFHTLVFIEKDPVAAQSLRELKELSPERKMVVVEGEANQKIQQLCRQLPWRGSENLPKGMRAVMFLDPFALSVDWETLLAIGKSRGVDLWYLLPVGAMNRLLTEDLSKVGPHAEEHLNRILGGDWWKDEFYETQPAQTDLFGDDNETGPRKTGSRLRIEEAFIARMKPHFGYVHPRGLRLKKQGQHYFSLIFAVSNPARAAVDLAKKFAQSIIDKPQGFILPQRSQREP